MAPDLTPRATEIAELTRVLLADGGYNGFSYADLSARIGISKASIHHHFPSKAELVLAVVQRHRAQSLQGLATLQQHLPDDPHAQLSAYANYWAACIAEAAPAICICAMLAAEAPMLPAPVAAEVQAYFQDLAGWLAAVLQHGAERRQFQLRGSAADEAQTLMATVHGAMLSARALGAPATFRSITDAAIDRLLA